ncbi:hypothetical protein FRC08_010233 [Ceratobasidium sp. 394]|nr:hypothetical protein FRC08_010233 [Ceratobasidium sp. 394]
MIDKSVKGSIVLVSSMSANIVNVPQPQTPYNSSKAGTLLGPVPGRVSTEFGMVGSQR